MHPPTTAVPPAADLPGDILLRPRAARRAGDWVVDRFGLAALAYPVPRHANSLAYTLGGITFGSFVLLGLTGIYLMQFYDPAPAEAHASVVAISGTTTGAIVRSVHFWLANVFIVTLLLHLARTFATASYKRPREALWLTGVGLFAVGGGLLFTGTVLKWDQEAVEAYGHNSAVAELLGGFGYVFSTGVSSLPLLTRLYVAHISILPLLLVGFVGVHALLVKRHRISPLPSGTPDEIEQRARSEPTFPFTAHLVRILYWTLVALAFALVMTALRPTGIGPEGVEGIEITKPPWYFIWLYPLENWFGLKAIVVFPFALLAGLAALPFLDRGRERDPRRRRRWMALGTAIVVLWVALTIYAYVTVPVSHVG